MRLMGITTSRLRRYHYRYVLFSVSGFSPEAQKFALAHQISLIDLQGSAFSDLRVNARNTARRLHGLASSAGLKSFPIKQMRHALRRALGTWSLDERFTAATEMNKNSFFDPLPDHSLDIIALGLKRLRFSIMETA